MTFLSINGLSSRYASSKGPVYAVDDVDFELDSGESLGIAGESACGKSTLGLSLIRMLSGGESYGQIMFDGDSILDGNRFWYRYRIIILFQSARSDRWSPLVYCNWYIGIRWN